MEPSWLDRMVMGSTALVLTMTGHRADLDAVTAVPVKRLHLVTVTGAPNNTKVNLQRRLNVAREKYVLTN